MSLHRVRESGEDRARPHLAQVLQLVRELTPSACGLAGRVEWFTLEAASLVEISWRLEPSTDVVEPAEEPVGFGGSEFA